MTEKLRALNLLVAGGLGNAQLASLVLVACGLLACSAHEVPRSVPLVLNESRAPFAVSVKEEGNDGRYLHVLAEIKPLAGIAPWELVLRITGYRAGEQIVSSIHRIDEQISVRSTNQQLTPVPVVLSIPAQGITDYQLELYWGAAAAAVLKESGAARDQLTVVKRALTQGTVSCQGEECPGQLKVTALVKNVGSEPLDQVVLRVGVVPRMRRVGGSEGAGLVQLAPRNITIDNLDLGVGQQREVRFSFSYKADRLALAELEPVVEFVGVAP